MALLSILLRRGPELLVGLLGLAAIKVGEALIDLAIRMRQWRCS